AGVTAHVAIHRGLRSMNALHAAWGVGSTLGTLLVTAAVAESSWRVAYALMAALYVALLAVLLQTRLETVARSGEPSRSPRLSVGLGFALALFFVYTGLESVAGAWSYSFLVAHDSPLSAGLLVSGFWAAFT